MIKKCELHSERFHSKTRSKTVAASVFDEYCLCVSF